METPAQESKQNPLVVTGSSYAAGSVVEARDASGSVHVFLTSPKQLASVISSSPEIDQGTTYSVCIDGESMEEIEATEVTSGAESDFYGSGRDGRGDDPCKAACSRLFTVERLC